MSIYVIRNKKGKYLTQWKTFNADIRYADWYGNKELAEFNKNKHYKECCVVEFKLVEVQNESICD